MAADVTRSLRWTLEYLSGLGPRGQRAPGKPPSYATAGWGDWYYQRRVHTSLGHRTATKYETA
jgi:hypothetical protein